VVAAVRLEPAPAEPRYAALGELGAGVVASTRASVRSAGDGDALGVMFGHFSVFDEPYEVDSLREGRFVERVMRGAFAETFLRDRRGMKVQFDHGVDVRFGDVVLGTITDLAEDNVGARYEVALFDTAYNRDLLPGLRAGAYGSSMRFRVVDDQWTDNPPATADNPNRLTVRRITQMRVYEFGPVTWPATPAATSGVRGQGSDAAARRREHLARQHADKRRAQLALHTASRPADRPLWTRERRLAFLAENYGTPQEHRQRVSATNVRARERALRLAWQQRGMEYSAQAYRAKFGTDPLARR
jgi:HK97 family phage prohead protease